MAAQTLTLCGICGEALDIDMESARFAGQFLEEGLLCDGCRNDPPQFERAVAYAVYQNELRGMIHLLKYERMSGVAKMLGPMLATAILSLEEQAAQNLVVVPVPLFPSKQRQRGYNQSELLARAALKELGRLRPDWNFSLQPAMLSRQRETRSQFELNPTSRRRNVQKAFEVNRSLLRAGCEVLLVDDILTTGATARECSRALRDAGAGKVWVATLARAQRPRVQAIQTDDVAMWGEQTTVIAQGFG